jgi:predicted nucleotidyltransferase
MIRISADQKEGLEAIRRDFGLRLIVAFGSQVEGRTHAASDLDIGILLNRASDLRRGLFSRFSEVFSEYEVDLALLNRADPLLLKEVCRNAVLLAGAEIDLQELRIYAFKRFVEYRPFFELEAATNRRHLEVLARGA